VPTQLIRRRIANREVLTLLCADYAITIELTVRGLELDATTVERLLHAPLTELTRERI
jgi:hypothetical protein